MANISHFTQTVNGVSTTYDIHDAGAIPRSGGAVLSGTDFGRVDNNNALNISGGIGWGSGATVSLFGKNSSSNSGSCLISVGDSTNNSLLFIRPDGSMPIIINGNTTKNLAMREDVIPRSGGAVMTGATLSRNIDTDSLLIRGGTVYDTGAQISMNGANRSSEKGVIQIQPNKTSSKKYFSLTPDGTLTWDGTAIQYISDKRLKQQISQIDDNLLNAWKDVELVQFKYNDAVNEKGDTARLHTGYVVQQIDEACKSHNVDISQYGLYCHEEYPEETEEVEVEQADGTKVKEKKVIREASEHYSLRYTEALIVECKYLRRCIARLTARIEELEKGNITK